MTIYLPLDFISVRIYDDLITKQHYSLNRNTIHVTETPFIKQKHYSKNIEIIYNMKRYCYDSSEDEYSHRIKKKGV